MADGKTIDREDKGRGTMDAEDRERECFISWSIQYDQGGETANQGREIFT